MPQWQRALAGGFTAVWLAAALLVAAPGAASAAEEEPDEVCAVLESLGDADPPSSAAVTAELFNAVKATGTAASRSSVAQRVIACITESESEADSAAANARTDEAICRLARALNEKEQFEESLKLIDGSRAAREDRGLCDGEYKTATTGARPNVNPQGLGELWDRYQKNVVQPLAPIASFASLTAIAIFALARLVVMVSPFKDSRSTKWGRRIALGLGLLLATVAPVLIAARAMWYGDRPPAGDDAAAGFYGFLGQLMRWAPGRWLLYAGLAVAAILLLAYWFATRRRMTIEITPKADGGGLDGTRLMASLDGMVGRPNTGIEFPVGTDIVDEAKTVAEVSDNKFVAAFQAFTRLVFGASPWRLKVENEAGNAVSIAVSRNGRLKLARRLEISERPPLNSIPEPAEVTRLAALVAGEVIAVLAPKYRSELGRGLNGATDATSIAYQYIASKDLSSTRQLRAHAIPLLHRALAIDPGNRGAAATLENFIYRDPEREVVDHRAYQRFLESAIDNELRRMAVRRPIFVLKARLAWLMREAWGAVPPLPNGSTKISLGRLSRNDLLLRLLQTHAVVTRNLAAAGELGTADASRYDALYLYVYARLKKPRAPLALHVRRRQLFLIDRFYALAWSPATGSARVRGFAKDGFVWRERRAWGRPADADTGSLVSRFQREESVLRTVGDFDQDPVVAYSLACYRAAKWL